MLGAFAASCPGGVTPTKKNRLGTRWPKYEKSSAPVTNGISSTLPGPAARSSDGSMRSVSFTSLKVTGFASGATSTSALAPLDEAMSFAVRVMPSMICWRTLGSNVRNVPIISTWSGMMLLRMPPLMAPTDTTAGCAVMSIWRLTSVCRPITICAEATIGSTPPQGFDPWVCSPLTRIRKRSDAAMNGPAR